MQTEVNALDAKQDDIGGFSFRFYLLKLRSKKNDWAKIGALVGTIFSAKQRKQLHNTNFAVLARHAYKRLATEFPELLEKSDDEMSYRLTEQGLAELDGIISSHDLPGEISARKKAKTSEQLAADSLDLKKKNKELLETIDSVKADNERLMQLNAELTERVAQLVGEMHEARKRAVLEMSLLNREMDTLMTKFSIDDGEERSHVQRLLQGIQLGISSF
jgi:hypothetical protein